VLVALVDDGDAAPPADLEEQVHVAGILHPADDAPDLPAEHRPEDRHHLGECSLMET